MKFGEVNDGIWKFKSQILEIQLVDFNEGMKKLHCCLQLLENQNICYAERALISWGLHLLNFTLRFIYEQKSQNKIISRPVSLNA